jgi:hypothetical protein
MVVMLLTKRIVIFVNMKDQSTVKTDKDIFMTFDQLLKYHSFVLIITLNNNEVYEGIITTHIFLDKGMKKIKQITLTGDKTSIKIQCDQIKKIDIKK